MKKKLILCFIIELVLIVFFSIKFFSHKNEQLHPIETIGTMQTSDHDDGYVLPEAYYSNKKTSVLEINYGSLDRGLYHGYAFYNAGNNEQNLSFKCSDNNRLRINNIILDPRLDRASFYLEIAYPVDDFTIIIEHKGNADFSIDLQLFTSRKIYTRNIFCALSIFSLLELFIWLYYKNRKKFVTIFCFVIFSLIALIPYLQVGIKPGHDFTYHFLRIEGIVNAIESGQFPVYMESLWAGNYGYPVSLFYCDILLHIPALFRILGFPYDFSYKIFVLLINFMTSYSAFSSFKRIFKSKKLALLLSFIYLCSPYRFVDIYVRSAVGEYCAMIFLPMVCAGYYGIITSPVGQSKKISRDIVLLFSLGMAGVFLTHLLTFEMTLFILFVISLLLCKKIFNWHRIKAILNAGFQFALMTAFFAVPFLDSYLNNDIEIKKNMELTIPMIQKNGVMPGEFFMFFKDLFGSGHLRPSTDDRMYLSLGLFLTVTVSIAIILFFKGKSHARMNFFTGMACLCLFLSSNLFPYDDFAYYSKIGVWFSQIQFPWRYLTLATLFAVLVLGDLLMILLKIPVPFSGVGKTGFFLTENSLAVIAAILVLLETFYLDSNYSTAGRWKVYYNTYDIEAGAESPTLYLRYGTDISKLPYRITGENVSVQRIKQTGTTWKINCKTEENKGTVIMPLFNYKGYHVIDEYNREYEIIDGNNKEISFSLPSNYSGKVDIFFQPMWYWLAAAGSSLGYFIFLLIRQYLFRKKNHAVL